MTKYFPAIINAKNRLLTLIDLMRF